MTTLVDMRIALMARLLIVAVVGFSVQACGPKVVASNPNEAAISVVASNGFEDVDGTRFAYSRVVVGDQSGVSRDYMVLYDGALYPKLTIQTSGVRVYLVASPGGTKRLLEPGRTVLSSTKTSGDSKGDVKDSP